MVAHIGDLVRIHPAGIVAAGQVGAYTAALVAIALQRPGPVLICRRDAQLKAGWAELVVHMPKLLALGKRPILICNSGLTEKREAEQMNLAAQLGINLQYAPCMQTAELMVSAVLREVKNTGC